MAKVLPFRKNTDAAFARVFAEMRPFNMEGTVLAINSTLKAEPLWCEAEERYIDFYEGDERAVEDRLYRRSEFDPRRCYYAGKSNYDPR